MARDYSLTGTLPKDAGGQKFAAWVDDNSSISDFALPRGIGASEMFGKFVAHLGVATYTQGSRVEPLAPLVTLGGPYIESAAASPATSPVSGGSAQIAGMTNWNELFTRPAPLNASQVTTSANLIKNGSGIVFGMTIAMSGGSQGDVVRLRDSLADKITFISPSRFGTWNVHIPDGGIVFDTTIAHAQTISDENTATSVMVSFR